MHHSPDAVVVGAGCVGLTLAIHMANQGLSILALDIDEKKIETLKRGQSPMHEQGIERALHQAIESNRLSFSIVPPLQGAPVWIITSAYIPEKPESYLQCFPSVRGEDGKPPLVSIRTTIPVGLTRQMIIPFLEKQFQGRLDEAFFVSLCPERTLSGAAVEELANLPQLIAGTGISIEKTKIVFERAGIRCIALQSFEAAELAKTFTNFYRFSQFNLANFFGVCCHRFGVSEDLLRQALSEGYGRFDLKEPGPGVGGFCLPKDALVLRDGLNFRSETLDGSTPKFADLFENPRSEYLLNENIIHYFQESVLAAVKRCRRILALGIAFKGVPATDDMRGSVGTRMVDFLVRAGHQVEVYDACVGATKIQELAFTPASQPLHLADYDAFLLLNNHPQNRQILLKKPQDLPTSSVVIYDPWRLVLAPRESILQTDYHWGIV